MLFSRMALCHHRTFSGNLETSIALFTLTHVHVLVYSLVHYSCPPAQEIQNESLHKCRRPVKHKPEGFIRTVSKCSFHQYEYQQYGRQFLVLEPLADFSGVTLPLLTGLWQSHHMFQLVMPYTVIFKRGKAAQKCNQLMSVVPQLGQLY